MRLLLLLSILLCALAGPAAAQYPSPRYKAATVDQTLALGTTAMADDGTGNLDVTLPAGKKLRVNGVELCGVNGCTFTGAVNGVFDVRNAALPRFLRSGITPSVHLPKFLAATSPLVCFVGDSTTTEGANNVTPIDLLQGRIRQQLMRHYPQKTITFGGYGMGGHTLDGWTQVEPSPPSWYTDHSKTWAEMVGTFGCDVLVINFGVVGSTASTIAEWKAALAAVMLWAKTPDIIMASPAIANIAAGAPYTDATRQAGYRHTGGALRTLTANYAFLGIAGLPPLGLLDINRQWQMSVGPTAGSAGVDPVSQPFSYVYNPNKTPPETASISSFPALLAATPGGDFYLRFTVPSGAALYAAGSSITVTMGSTNGTGSSGGNQVNISTANGTTCSMTYFAGSGISRQNAGAGVWSSSVNTFEIHAQGDHIRLGCNGTVLGDFTAPRLVGGYTPQISINSPPASPSITVTAYAVGTPRTLLPTVNAADCYGQADEAGPNGGNGINHDSSVCLSAVYGEVVEGTTWLAATAPAAANVITTTYTCGQSGTHAFAATTRTVRVRGHAGGAPGAGGRGGSATASGGAGGGGGGNFDSGTVSVIAMGASAAYSVGCGGIGGTPGNAGTAATDTSFTPALGGAYFAGAGGRGAPGQASAHSGGGAGGDLGATGADGSGATGGAAGSLGGGAGGSGTAGGAATVTGAGSGGGGGNSGSVGRACGSTLGAASGGGGGGGLNAGTPSAGGPCGGHFGTHISAAGTAGGATGGNGADGEASAAQLGGNGGAGGGAGTVTGGNGGKGGFPGGGGGGGGAGGTTGGSGGNGGDGYILVEEAG